MLDTAKNNGKGLVRRAIATALVVVAAMAAVVAPSPAYADTATYKFVPTRLVVLDIEDWWPDDTDEVRMYYGGIGWGASVRNGGTAYPPAVTFSGSTIHVDVHEWDRGYDRYLGTWEVQATDLNLEKDKDLGIGSGFHYRLYYKVCLASDPNC